MRIGRPRRYDEDELLAGIQGDVGAYLGELERALVANGESSLIARNVSTWLLIKHLNGGVDRISIDTRAKYRRALAELPELPTERGPSSRQPRRRRAGSPVEHVA